jgi:hypothetical protein
MTRPLSPTRFVTLCAVSLWIGAGLALSANAEPSADINQEVRKTDPLEVPFGMDPSARSMESSQRLREGLRDQDLRVDPDPNRRMFRPKQPEPGYSEIRPYSGADSPARVRPIRPIP